MNIVQVNLSYNIGSTGKIMKDLNDVIEKKGHSSFMVAGYSTDTNVKNLYCFNKGNTLNAMRKDILISRITGEMGYRNKVRTIEAIQWIKSKQPDIIHLHNIHGDWINVEILFKYLKEFDIPVVWTLHDCWSFTGRCSHFENYGCLEWKNGCKIKCENKVYPLTYFFDKSEKMWNDKYCWFRGINTIQLVTPSNWLGEFLKDSFLNEYPVMTIHNGIDTRIFNIGYEHRKYSKKFDGKKIVLGVANSWSENKGLFDFFKLANMLDKNEFQIVLVGLNHKQLKLIPESIIGIERTHNQKELATLYSQAFVFVNPTYQDNFPTTNLEAICCGTPVITYDTGGSPECLVDESIGYKVNKGEIDKIAEKINELKIVGINKQKISMIGRKIFDKNVCFNLYIQLYEKIKG